MSLPPTAHARTTNWDVSVRKSFSASFLIAGAEVTIWRFRNRDNSYQIDLVSLERSLGARIGATFGGGNRNSSLANSATQLGTSYTLNESLRIHSPFAAYELIAATIERMSFGASAVGSITGDVLWIKPRLNRRTIIELKTGALSATAGAEVNIGTLGEGVFYGPI